jgi:flagellin
MRELAVQSSNDTNNDKDRGFLDGEFQQLRNEIDRIGQNTQWNGANILDGTGGNQLNGTFAFQVGANSQQTIEIKLPNMQTGGTSSSAPVVTIDATTGAADMSFTSFDTTTPSASLGVTVQATVGNKAVQYQITQADIDSVDVANPGTTMSDAIAAGLKSKLQATYGTSGTYTLDVATTAGHLVVNPDTANTGLAALTSTTGKAAVVEGNLSAIGGTLDITSAAHAYDGLQAIDTALQVVNAARSNMGAIISRLQFATDNLANVAAKAQESRSRIEDTDYSIATTELAKRNIIQQAAQAMLAQANQAPQMVLQLLK